MIATDLITPLGAYLRVREAGGASFLLESVEKGRLGRYSLLGAGSRLVSFDEAAQSAEPVEGARVCRGSGVAHRASVVSAHRGRHRPRA